MKALLDFLDRHILGILTTIVLHLAIITVFLVIQMRTKNLHHTTEIVIDFSQVDQMQKDLEQMKKEVKQQPKTEFIKELQQQYLGKNIPVNENAHDAQKSIDDMEKEIKKELNINDNTIRDTTKIEKIEKPKDKGTPKIEKKSDFFNDKGEPSVFRGATTISYNLKGRKYMYIPTPQYKCEGGGKVVLDVLVNPKGYVLTADINRAKSQISEECIVETAIRAALVTRFDEKSGAEAKQPGTITFIFVAQ